MSDRFTEDDVGKTVENAAGTSVGVVASVRDGVAHVRPDPAVVDSIKSSLGWDGGGTETRRLEPASVREITDETVRLEGDRPESEASTDRAAEAAAPDPTDDESADATGTDRGPEVDPSALTDRDSGPEVDPGEADRRTDAEVELDADRRRTDAAVDPDDVVQRDDADGDPDDG